MSEPPGEPQAVHHTVLTPELVARIPAPGMNVPAMVRFSPDGRLLTFLYSEDGSLNRQLYAFDPETGRRELLVRPPGEGVTDANVSREEALRRERQRERGFGVTSYAWSRTGDTLLVPVRGALYVQNGAGGSLREVAGGDLPCIDPQLNHDGSMVAFVRAGELHSLDLTQADAQPLRLTHDASSIEEGQEGEQLVTNGLAEFVAQEEMGRSTGFWWSRDGTLIAFERVDNTPVTPYAIVHQGEDAVAVETHRYPFAGGRNVAVRLGVVPAGGGEVTWLPLEGVGPDEGYLTRVDWAPDGALLVQAMTRDQKRLELRRIDPATRASTLVLVETAPDWINLHDDLRFVARPAGEGSDILWSSERTGVRQLYLYSADGSLLRQLTYNPWPVDGVSAVDEQRRLVHFRGSGDNPTNALIWRVSLDGGETERVRIPIPGSERGVDATRSGMHAPVFSPDCSRFANLIHSSSFAPDFWLCNADESDPLRVVHSDLRPPQADDANEPGRARPGWPGNYPYGLRRPQLMTLYSRHGVPLYGALYRPPNPEPGRRYPVLVEVYGGPHVQTVYNGWGITASMRAQFLAQQGFVVFKLDNRGSARRGHEFEASLYRRMGTVEVEDQVDGVRWLAENVPEADTSRTGIYGWSYGGYMTLMCLLKAPEVFKAGVAGAPVASWDGYDTFYTERYMETPEANPEGYQEGSALTYAGRLSSALMLLHGMLDENVHFRHTARLANALNAALKPYDLVIFPSERHGPRSEAQRAALELRLLDFFKRHLAAEGDTGA
jgi:dipeptidyl-peptidase-4